MLWFFTIVMRAWDPTKPAAQTLRTLPQQLSARPQPHGSHFTGPKNLPYLAVLPFTSCTSTQCPSPGLRPSLVSWKSSPASRTSPPTITSNTNTSVDVGPVYFRCCGHLQSADRYLTRAGGSNHAASGPTSRNPGTDGPTVVKISV